METVEDGAILCMFSGLRLMKALEKSKASAIVSVDSRTIF